jgi:DNA-binding response OmpR family regulator
LDRPRILVVEDQDYLTRPEAQAWVPDGVGAHPAAALREIARTPPHLLVLDLMLSDGGDGRDVLRSLPTRTFPILIFTSKDEQEMYGPAWDELKALGANDLLIKGINVSDELQRKVEALLAGGSRAEPAAVPPPA